MRVFLAILFFAPILLYFVDFATVLPQGIHSLLHVQMIPAILSGAVGIIVLQFVIALFFGRIYCSVLCPAGVFQDMINRVFCLGKKKSKGVRRFSYHKPPNIFRYGMLGLVLLSLLSGLTTLVVWFDPYSNFGRIAANLFRPVVMWGNNLLADVLMRMENYSLYHVTIHTVTWAGLFSAALILLVLLVLTVFRGRLFCNTLCPVGTLLSLVSRYAFFRITFKEQLCNRCGNCERSCKAEAIDSKRMKVDASRCVACFNCTSSCTKQSLGYRFAPFPGVGKTTESRRKFFATGAGIAASLPVVSALASSVESSPVVGSSPRAPQLPVTPPGSMNLERFKDQCTACHLCVVRCPTQVLRPAGLQFGFDYLLRPYCAFKSSYCNYECTVCGDVCPVQAIQRLTKEEKRTTQVGIATFHIDRCIVYTEGTDCGACSEHCPTQAVHMTPYEGTLTIPQVEPALCIGCGGCESICPVNPLRAILVVANEEHQQVAPPEEEEVEEIKIDNFGF
ncbi:MAG: 4Fe-4S binding protein [Tannerellaceae bacterium]|nr:4Fe-4S binding protein [Tannerellaceae bacterium]